MEEGFTVLVNGEELVSGVAESEAVDAIENAFLDDDTLDEDSFQVFEVVERSVSIEVERNVTIN